MRCVVFAYHEIGCEGLKALAELGQKIAAVFTHEDDAREEVWFGSVRALCKEKGWPVFTPENLNEPSWVEKVRALEPDIIFSFYYRKLVPESILRLPPKGGLNLHGSLLPKYRGRAPVNWALVNGETETGLTLHYMVKQPDAGDIVAQRKAAIAGDDTALTLYRKLIPLARELLLDAVPKLERGKAPRKPQDPSLATYFGGRKPEDGRIDWTKPSRQIYNLVRAVTHPYPGAFTFYNGRKFWVWKAGVSERSFPAVPGTVVELDPLTVACGAGSLVLLRVQAEAGEETDGEAWAKALNLKSGERLGGEHK